MAAAAALLAGIATFLLWPRSPPGPAPSETGARSASAGAPEIVPSSSALPVPLLATGPLAAGACVQRIHASDLQHR